MPVTDPLLWDEFLELCERKNYSLTSAALLALGKLADFEEMLRTDGQHISQYLSERLRSSINAWQEEQKREDDRGNDTQTIEESFCATDEYLDEEGYWHFQIQL
jgi:hypothetical protein